MTHTAGALLIAATFVVMAIIAAAAIAGWKTAAAITAAIIGIFSAAVIVAGGPAACEIGREYGPEHITVVYMDGHQEQEPYVDWWTGDEITASK